jgi:hypothetical protein
MRSWIPHVSLAVGLLVAPGCDEHAGAPPVSTSTEEADVTGVVKFRGKPVKNGTVTFHSANIRRATQDRIAPIKADGSYSIKAFQGGNVVILDCKELQTQRGRQIREFERQFDVQPGSNTFDIEAGPEPRDSAPSKAPKRPAK